MIKKDLGFITSTQLLKLLNIPRCRLNYLFESGKIKREEIGKLPTGDYIYSPEDVEKIKELLFR